MLMQGIVFLDTFSVWERKSAFSNKEFGKMLSNAVNSTSGNVTKKKKKLITMYKFRYLYVPYHM